MTIAPIDVIQSLSWAGISVAALAYYLLGAVWFTPLFGRAWDGAIGFERPPKNRFPVSYYVVPLVSAVLVTVAVAVILALADPASFVDALALGVVIGGAITLPVSVNNALTPHTPKPFVLGFVTGCYHLVGIAAVAVILYALG